MSWAKEVWAEVRRPLVAIMCVFLGFVLAMAAFSAINGMWPPLMAVQSKSMQHSDSSSQVGIIDTGDVVVGRRTYSSEDVRTYVEALPEGYRSFGDYGDVVIYHEEGDDIPVVHRAILEVVYNGHGSFDIPELADLPTERWATPGAEGRWWDLDGMVELHQVGYAQTTVLINLGRMLDMMGPSPHGGLITMGDNNWMELGNGRIGEIDQGNLVDEPVTWDQVLGKVVGEVPWLGSLRLWITGTAPDYLPLNSVVMLAAVVVGLVAFPALLWKAASMAERSKAPDGRTRR